MTKVDNLRPTDIFDAYDKYIAPVNRVPKSQGDVCPKEVYRLGRGLGLFGAGCMFMAKRIRSPLFYVGMSSSVAGFYFLFQDIKCTIDFLRKK